ncbi:MAG: hypothetical protein QW514_06920 [Thermoprotei archaeon]
MHSVIDALRKAAREASTPIKGFLTGFARYGGRQTQSSERPLDPLFGPQVQSNLFMFALTQDVASMLIYGVNIFGVITAAIIVATLVNLHLFTGGSGGRA